MDKIQQKSWAKALLLVDGGGRGAIVRPQQTRAARQRQSDSHRPLNEDCGRALPKTSSAPKGFPPNPPPKSSNQIVSTTVVPVSIPHLSVWDTRRVMSELEVFTSLPWWKISLLTNNLSFSRPNSWWFLTKTFTGDISAPKQLSRVGLQSRGLQKGNHEHE